VDDERHVLGRLDAGEPHRQVDLGVPPWLVDPGRHHRDLVAQSTKSPGERVQRTVAVRPGHVDSQHDHVPVGSEQRRTLEDEPPRQLEARGPALGEDALRTVDLTIERRHPRRIARDQHEGPRGEPPADIGQAGRRRR